MLDFWDKVHTFGCRSRLDYKLGLQNRNLCAYITLEELAFLVLSVSSFFSLRILYIYYSLCLNQIFYSSFTGVLSFWLRNFFFVGLSLGFCSYKLGFSPLVWVSVFNICEFLGGCGTGFLLSLKNQAVFISEELLFKELQ